MKYDFHKEHDEANIISVEHWNFDGALQEAARRAGVPARKLFWSPNFDVKPCPLPPIRFLDESQPGLPANE